MCLGADAIYMGDCAELGPIDVQISDPVKMGGDEQLSPLDEFKAADFLCDYAVEILDHVTQLIVQRSEMNLKEAFHESLHFTAEIMRPLYEQLHPLEIGQYKRALAIGKEYGVRLLDITKNPHAKTISKLLLSKYPSHGFVIDCWEAETLGLPVRALDSAQEALFLSALDNIRRSGESLCGFSEVPAPKPATRPIRKKQAASPKTGAIQIAAAR